MSLGLLRKYEMMDMQCDDVSHTYVLVNLLNNHFSCVCKTCEFERVSMTYFHLREIKMQYDCHYSVPLGMSVWNNHVW